MAQITGRLNPIGAIQGALNPVYGGGAEELSELHDVQITDVQNNQVLKYDVGFSKWRNVSPDNAFPIWDETEADITMNEMLGGIAMVAMSGDQTDKVMELYFNYPLVCPTVISVGYSESLDQTNFYIGVPYMAVNDMKVLISLRNKRS